MTVATNEFDIEAVRAQFLSLKLKENNSPVVFLDNPGGTQVPVSVMDAVTQYYATCNANVGGAFATSRRTDAVVSGARRNMADLLNAAHSHEIVFGANMTTLTFHIARSIAETIRPGDEIVVTNLDHDANVSPWTDLQTQGAVIRSVDIDLADCTLALAAVEAALSDRTRLVAITHASNAVGTIPDVAGITRLAHAAGALVFVDAVQYAPHAPIDVQALDCDFLACSAYKFFGPHVGILYGKAEHLERLTPHKVRPAKNTIPHCWETGTLNHEGLAGTSAAVRYLASLAEDRETSPDENSHSAGIGEAEESPLVTPEGHTWGQRQALRQAMRAVKQYEETLSRYLLSRLAEIDDITVYGITDPTRVSERVPTFAFTWPRLTPRGTVEHLATQGIAAWSGNYYALRLMERLGLEAEGGAVRIGLAHYNTTEEIDRLMNALKKVRK